MSVIPPFGVTWLVRLECKGTNSFLNGHTTTDPADPLHGTVDLQGNADLSGAKWAMTSVNQATVSLRCMGTIEGVRFLNGDTAHRTVALAPVTSGVFTGTRWFPEPDQSDPNAIALICAGTAPGGVQLAASGSGVVLTNHFFPAPPNALWRVQPLGLLVILQCMGTAPGPAHRFLNGRTRDIPPTVDLQDLTSGPNTGTLWLIAQADGGNVTLSCQGVLGGPSFLRGLTDDSTVSLVDSPDGLGGTKWSRANHPVDGRYVSIGCGGPQGPFLNGTTFAGGPIGPGSVNLAPRNDGIFTGTMWRETSPAIWWEPCSVTPISGPAHLPVMVRNVERLAQLTGFHDPEGVQMTKDTRQEGVGGTDLGANCKDPSGNLFIFFGDVIPSPDPDPDPKNAPDSLRDSHFVASIEAGSETTSLTAASLTAVTDPNTGSYDPIKVDGDIGITHTFEVASGAFWWNNKVHVFMHINADTRNRHGQPKPPQGCYLVSKANPSRPGPFQFEFAFSPRMSPPPDYTVLSTNPHPSEKFGGVAPVIVTNADHPWLPSQTGQGLVMFGIGYNNDPPDNVNDLATHLAWMPLVEGQDPSPDTVRYYVGTDDNGKPKWSPDGSADSQDAAVHLFGAERNMQSISAMWDPDARGWLIMHMTADNKVNIVDPVIARIGETPLAMSDSFAVFDPCREAAYGKYMHWPDLGSETPPPHTIHDQCDPQRPDGSPDLPDGPAWAYGAFLLDGRSKIDPIRGNVDLYYLLSLSSPYQVQLMHSSLQVRLPGSLLFYNAQTGDGKTAIADSAGGFRDPVQTFGKWTHVVGTPGGGVLFYNAGDGSAATAVVDSKGQYNFKKSLDPLSTGWTHITSVGRHGLFFYNSRTGKAATALLDGAGNFTKCENLVGFGQWTHVVGSVTGRMLFYNSSTGGTGATATVDASGHYAFAQSIGGFARGWSHIVAVGAGLLFYNSSNQTGATGSIDDSGDFVSGENLDLDRWTDVVGLRNGSIFFYKFGNTAADPPLGATAAIDKDGHYVAHQTFPLFADFPPFPTSPWSWITAVSS